jgi:hypothetical protein
LVTGAGRGIEGSWRYDDVGRAWWLVPHPQLHAVVRSTYQLALGCFTHDRTGKSFDGTIFARAGGEYRFTGAAHDVQAAGEALMAAYGDVRYDPPRLVGTSAAARQQPTDLSPAAQTLRAHDAYTAEWQNRFAQAHNTDVLGLSYGPGSHETIRRFLRGGHHHVWRERDRHVRDRTLDMGRWVNLIAQGGIPALIKSFDSAAGQRWRLDAMTVKLLLAAEASS